MTRLTLHTHHCVVWTQVSVDRPALAEAVESRRTGVAVEEGVLEPETALTIKPNGAENSEGPASRRRDNIGAPVVQAAIHVDTQWVGRPKTKLSFRLPVHEQTREDKEDKSTFVHRAFRI